MRVKVSLQIDGNGIYRNFEIDTQDDIDNIDWNAQIESMTDSIMSHNPLIKNENS